MKARLVQQYMNSTGMPELIIQGLIREIRQAAYAFCVSQDQIDTFVSIHTQEVHRQRANLEERLADIISTTYDTEELQAMVALFKDEFGRRLARVEAEVEERMVHHITERMQVIEQRVRREMDHQPARFFAEHVGGDYPMLAITRLQQAWAKRAVPGIPNHVRDDEIRRCARDIDDRVVTALYQRLPPGMESPYANRIRQYGITSDQVLSFFEAMLPAYSAIVSDTVSQGVDEFTARIARSGADLGQ